MTNKQRSEMFSQKIDTSADIIIRSLTLLEGFVILDLKHAYLVLNMSYVCLIMILRDSDKKQEP